MDEIFERSKTISKHAFVSGDTNAQIDPENFNGNKSIQEAWEFIMQEFVHTKNPDKERKDSIESVDYNSVDEFLEMQINQLKNVLEKVDLEIVENQVDEELLKSSDAEIEEIENMYK